MYWRTIDGLWLPASLDSITSPYAETATGGRGSPANLISKITNLGVLHHLELISVACEGHSALLAPCKGASISRRRCRFRSLWEDWQRSGRSRLEGAGGSGRCEAERMGFKWSSDGVSNPSLPRWRGVAASMEVLGDDRRLLEGLGGLSECRPQYIVIIGARQQGKIACLRINNTVGSYEQFSGTNRLCAEAVGLASLK